MHLQKTAGSAIIDTAREYYRDSLISHGDFLSMTRDAMRSTRFLSGHFGYDLLSELRSDRFAFTFLRDPVERVLSLYHYCLTRDPNEFPIYRLAHDNDIEQFVSSDDPVIEAHVVNYQTWQFHSGVVSGDLDERNRRQELFHSSDDALKVAEQHLDTFDFIGFHDSFDDDITTIYRQLDLGAPLKIRVINKTPDRPTRNDLSSEVRSVIEERNSLDMQLYEYARSHRPARSSLCVVSI